MRLVMDDRPDERASLEYASTPQQSHTRRAWVIAAVVSVVLVVTLLAYSRRDQVRWLWLQRAALASAPSPGALVFVDAHPGDPARPPQECMYNRPLEAFARYPVRQEVNGRSATVFTGRMRTPAGVQRIVRVDVSKLPETSEHGHHVIEVGIFAPATLSRGPQDHATFQRWMEGITHQPIESDSPLTMRITAGRIDPSDPSHLSFDRVLGNQRVTYDIWLRDPPPGLAHVEVLIEPGKPEPAGE